MNVARMWLAGIAVTLLPGVLLSAPPELSEIVPPAAQRGVESNLQFVGVGVKEAELLLPFAAEVRGGGSATFTVKPAPDTPPGVYPVRLRTPEGITNLRLLNITDAPVVRAREPNGRYKNGRLDLDQAQRIEVPCVVAGGRLVRDLDAYRFTVKAGERLVFVTETWRGGLTPDPVLRLRDARGRTLTYAHDTPGLQRDERIDYTFAEAGDYILEVQSTGGGGWNNHYLVKIGAYDYARAVFPLGGRRGDSVKFNVVHRDGKTSTVEARVPTDPHFDQWRLPLKDCPASLPWTLTSGDLPELTEDADRTGPQQITWPVTVNGRIAKPDEEDLYQIAVQPGQHIRVLVEAYHLGSRLDGYLMVYDPKGKKLLAKNDDQGYRGNPDPGLTFEVPTGVEQVVISLRDVLGQGGIEHGYRLTVERGGPDFFLRLGRKPSKLENVGWYKRDCSDRLSLPPGQEAKLVLSVRRNNKQDDPHYAGPLEGFTGPIRVQALNLPPGVAVKPLVIAGDKTEGELIFTASDEAPRQPFEIVVVGEGERPDGSVIRRIAERRLYLSDAAITNLPWNWRVTKVACLVARPTPPAAAKP